MTTDERRGPKRKNDEFSALALLLLRNNRHLTLKQAAKIVGNKVGAVFSHHTLRKCVEALTNGLLNRIFTWTEFKDVESMDKDFIEQLTTLVFRKVERDELERGVVEWALTKVVEKKAKEAEEEVQVQEAEEEEPAPQAHVEHAPLAFPDNEEVAEAETKFCPPSFEERRYHEMRYVQRNHTLPVMIRGSSHFPFANYYLFEPGDQYAPNVTSNVPMKQEEGCPPHFCEDVATFGLSNAQHVTHMPLPVILKKEEEEAEDMVYQLFGADDGDDVSLISFEMEEEQAVVANVILDPPPYSLGEYASDEMYDSVLPLNTTPKFEFH